MIAASIVSGFVDSIWKTNTKPGKAVQGIIFGIVALLGVFYPFVLQPGLIFDGRSVIISLCTLFYGPLAGLISAIITAIGRIYIGGIGAITGVSVITSSFLIGLIFYHLVEKRKIKLNLKNLYFFGILVHLAMLILMFTLPSKLAIDTLKTISITVIVFYPLATVLIGKIILYQIELRKLLRDLKESEYKFKLITDYSKDFIWMTDLKLNYIFLSPSVERIYGYTIEERKNKKATDLLTPESYSYAMKLLEEQFEIEAKYPDNRDRYVDVRFKEIRKDGKIVITEAVVTFIRDSNLKPIGIMGITRDITEKYLIEEEIREREEKYRLLVNNITDFIVKIDSSFNYIYRSDSFTKFFNKKEFANSFLSIFSDKEQISKLFANLGEKTEISYEQEIELDGSTTFILWKIRVIKGNNGGLQYLCVGRDITPLKIITEKLQESQEIFKTIFHSSPLIKFLVEKGTNIVKDINETFIQVFNLNQNVIRERVDELSFWCNPSDYYTIVDKLNRDGFVRNFETIMKLPNGEVRNILVFCELIIIRGTEHLVFSLLDITERKIAEDKLREINNELEQIIENRTEELNKALQNLSNSNYELQLLNQQMQQDAEKIIRLNEELQDAIASRDKFFSIIAHDLKNPFLTLLNNSEMLIRYYDRINETKKIELITNMKQASQSTYNLLENLLQWSRAQMGHLQVHSELLDITEIAHKVVSLVHPLAQNKNIQIVNSIPEKSFVLCDFEMTSTILRNLLTNAIKFSSNDSKIEIGISEVIFKHSNDKKIPYSVFFVKDYGVGIEEDKLEKLFSISDIEATKGTANEKGSGLGLIIVKEFVEKQNGEIWIESKAGVGTTVYFSLPMY
ncbi:MAG: PAS domain S-box protein [Bacteroidota bacterium]